MLNDKKKLKKGVKEKDKESYLKFLKQIRQEKNIDEIAELFSSIISMYGVTIDELAAINYYTFNNALNVPVTKKMLEDEFKINVNKLGVEGKLKVQQAFLSVYNDKYKGMVRKS